MAARTNKLKVLLSVGSATVGEYTLRTEPIDGGYRLTITRGSEVQTLDLLNGVGIAGIEKTASVGLTDVYIITLTDGSSYEFTVTNGSGGGSADVPEPEPTAEDRLDKLEPRTDALEDTTDDMILLMADLIGGM